MLSFVKMIVERTMELFSDITTSGEKIEGLEEHLTGRYAAEDIINPQTGEVIAKHNQLLDSNLANKIVAAGLKVKMLSINM